MEPIALNHSVAKSIKPKVKNCGLELSGYEALELIKTGNPYIAILNQYGHPQGLFTSESLGNHNGNLTLAELDLQPLPAIADRTTVKEFLDRLCQYEHSASIWAVVDRRNRYLGVLEVLPLIRRLTQELNDRPLRQFINLIEQLPFPALVSNLDYEVMGVNSLWHQEFTGYLDEWHGDRSHNLIGNSTGKLVKTKNRIWQINQAYLNGDLLGLIMATAQNVTAQEHLAQELSNQNADLLKLNRLKDEFIACISHEFKTPLTSVIGMASLLSTESVGNLNERQKRYVSTIHQNGRHLTFMIDNVMDMAKAETGQLELYPETLSVSSICRQSILKTQKLHQEANSTSAVDISLDIDPRVENIIADGVRVQQMLINLLSNAIKFVESIPQVKLSVQMWEGWIAFSVSDRGIGIPEAKQHLIFQKFQQLENILTRKYDGVGLGLVLTRHLARLHGGDVTFISQVGKGSEFTILLPPAPLDTSETSQFQVSSKQLVLVVENIPEDIDRLIELLTSLNYRAAIARSGIEALEKARKLQPSLICLNPDLPILSGWDVLSLLKKDPITSDIKVLMTIADNFTSILPVADFYASKPIQISDLDFLKAIAPKILDKLTILNIGESHSQNLIQELGCQVLTAADISQAEVLAKIWQPQLVLLDYVTELSAKLTRICQSTLKNLPIFVIYEINHQKSLDVELIIRDRFPHLNLHFLQQLSVPDLIEFIHTLEIL